MILIHSCSILSPVSDVIAVAVALYNHANIILKSEVFVKDFRDIFLLLAISTKSLYIMVLF